MLQDMTLPSNRPLDWQHNPVLQFRRNTPLFGSTSVVATLITLRVFLFVLEGT